MNTPSIRIGTRQIGAGEPPYIIAEIGVNHDGSVERALELVDAAAGAGADAVKLQLFRADLLMSKAARLAAYQKAAGESEPFEMLRRLELSIEQMAPIVARAHARGIHAIVTVFSLELVAEAERLGWDAYKSASPDIIHKPLLEALALTGKPLIVSTGASTMEEVERSVEWLSPATDRLALMQCVSCYPTPEDHRELGGIRAIQSRCGVVTGYSDHTATHIAGRYAVAAGADLLEKHLTYDRDAVGPDHHASLVPDRFRRYVAEARDAVTARRFVGSVTETHDFLQQMISHDLSHEEKAALDLAHAIRGESSGKRVLSIEQDVRGVSRQSIVARRDLPSGYTLARSDLTFKRPGTGIPPFRLDETLGRRIARAVEADMPLTDRDLT